VAMSTTDETPRPADASRPLVLRVPSRSHPGTFHAVDLEHQTCDCWAFVFSRAVPPRCRHLAKAQRMAEDEGEMR
jgi:hypothetical protein